MRSNFAVARRTRALLCSALSAEDAWPPLNQGDLLIDIAWRGRFRIPAVQGHCAYRIFDPSRSTVNNALNLPVGRTIHVGIRAIDADVRDFSGVGAWTARETRSSDCQRASEKLAVSRGPRVSVMQATNLRDRDHATFRCSLDSTRHRSISFKRKMSARFVIVREV